MKQKIFLKLLTRIDLYPNILELRNLEEFSSTVEDTCKVANPSCLGIFKNFDALAKFQMGLTSQWLIGSRACPGVHTLDFT